MWAAYKKGGLDGVPDGLDIDEFIAAAYGHLERFQEQFMVETDRPMGIIVTLTDGYRFEPHGIWFPWASPRNKLESWVRFFSRERKDRLGMIHMRSEPQNIDFLNHLAKYGLLRRIGTAKNFYAPGEDAVMFQTQEFR